MKPRTISSRERELLRLIAEGAMAMVKLQVASRHLLERTQQIEQELRQAVKVQQFLLPPKCVEGDGWRIKHLYRPVEHLGGDFIDLLERPDSRWAVFVADVSGHGASAALTTAMAKTAFRRAASWIATPEQLLDAMNRDLVDMVPPDQFVTALAALFAPGSLQLSFASAGHPHPSRIGVRGQSAGMVEHENDMPLCVDLKASYTGHTDMVVGPGERVLIYTDGAVEVQDASGAMLGSDGFIQLAADAARHVEDEPGSYLEVLLASLKAHAGGHLRDDIALLSVEVAP
jgi:sigma-B regulation protein RsbU (phosphoserine phosphatase)